jgi:hypothetical protein
LYLQAETPSAVGTTPTVVQVCDRMARASPSSAAGPACTTTSASTTPSSSPLATIPSDPSSSNRAKSICASATRTASATMRRALRGSAPKTPRPSCSESAYSAKVLGKRNHPTTVPSIWKRP